MKTQIADSIAQPEKKSSDTPALNKEQRDAILYIYSNPKSEASIERGVNAGVSDSQGMLNKDAKEWITNRVAQMAEANILEELGHQGKASAIRYNLRKEDEAP